MEILKKFKKNEFIKSVAVLMTGTVIAQVFSFLISPILTRIYSPEEMGDLNLYVRIVGFISALATARFELSLPLPKKDEHSYLLYRLSLRIAMYMMLGVVIISLFYFILTGFNTKLILFAILTFTSIVFIVITNLGTNWSIRKKHFKTIAISRMLNSGVSNLLKWGFGVLNWGSLGLILASLIGYLVSSISFVKEWFKIDRLHKNFRSQRKTKVLINTYREFPMVNLPHVLVDSGKDLLLAFFMIFYFSKDVFAWYSHSYSILQLPITIVGLAIGQVFFSKCAELVAEGKSTTSILKKTVISLFVLSIVPFTILFFFGRPLFSFVFGDNWENAGLYSEIMSIWFMINFLNSVVSTLPSILHRQKQFFYLGITSAVIQLSGFGLLPLYFGTGEEQFPKVLWVVSIVQSLFLIYVLYMMFKFSRLGVQKRY